MYAQRRLKSACASAQSDQSLRCPHEETLNSWLSKKGPSEDSDQTARMRRLNLRWARMSEGTFSDVAVQVIETRLAFHRLLLVTY